MFFGNDGAKDKKIAELEARVKELEAKQSTEDQIIDEINDVLAKAAKGFCGMRVDGDSSDPRVEQIKNNINDTLEYYSKYGDEAVEVLIEYGKANFAHKIKTDGLSGKLGSVILGIRALGSSVSELLALMDVSSSELNVQTKELNSASNALSDASNKQAARLEETAAALEEVTSTVISNTENSAQMSSFAQEVIKSAKNGQDMSNETDKAMDAINEQVSSINEAITIIDQIAFQTNILSLNAAVEAATAGEAGKGFAVVAGEVRNLANRSAEAAKEIKELVENATEKTKNGKDVAYKMTQGYEKLYENINSTIELINNVSNASKEQQQAIEQINDAITELDQVTQQNAAAASQINSQSGIIYGLSQKLVDTVTHTKYTTSAKEQICDIDQVFTLNRLKLDHINFKDTNFKKLNEKASFKVKTHHECDLGKWIDKHEAEGREFTKTQNWENLKIVHKNVHSEVQGIVDCNAQGNTAKMLEDCVNIDKAISDVFSSIQKVKKDNCKS